MKKKIGYQLSVISLITLGGFFVCFNGVQAAALGDQVTFYVDSGYDLSGRTQVTATLRVIGDRIYFYVEDDYWNSLNGTYRNALREKLEDLADEFDTVIYPKERSVFGSEWTPGIDGDERITVLITQLIAEAGGYVNTYDEYPRSQVDNSNEREMLYLNANRIFEGNAESFLAHEFQHLITFYQKTKLFGLEEEVWLNEARSEYAPTLCGYNDVYSGSYLADRVDIFLDNPSDSLTEWKNKLADYGVVSLFFHYLVDHYGTEILTRMVLNDKVGVASINQALKDLGYEETFSDIFADWAVASYLNNCQVEPKNKYCYLNDNLTYPRLHADYSASYSGFPNLIVSRSSAVKDWSLHWYRFRQTDSSTDRDTFKLSFQGLGSQADFRVPYILVDKDNQMTVNFIPLANQTGTLYVPDFGKLYESVIIAPFNQYKKSGFTANEPLISFSFTASSIKSSFPVISELTPQEGPTEGGFQITVKGEHFSEVKKIIFGQKEINDFQIVDDQTIIFTAPSHSAGKVDITLVNNNKEKGSLTNAFNFISATTPEKKYPDGSLLKAKGDYKVYVIKGNYKRWIQTAEIFNHYGHLRWEDVIEVEPEVLNQYQESWLIRAANDFRVYEVNADGTKHWLRMVPDEFVASGRRWEMVYLVNSWERDFYQTGPEILFH